MESDPLVRKWKFKKMKITVKWKRCTGHRNRGETEEGKEKKKKEPKREREKEQTVLTKTKWTQNREGGYKEKKWMNGNWGGGCVNL